MFNVGGGELMVIFLIALVVLGPDKLPGAARQAGKYMSEFRRISQGFQQELRDAVKEAVPDLDSPAPAMKPTSPAVILDPDAPRNMAPTTIPAEPSGVADVQDAIPAATSFPTDPDAPTDASAAGNGSNGNGNGNGTGSNGNGNGSESNHRHGDGTATGGTTRPVQSKSITVDGPPRSFS